MSLQTKPLILRAILIALLSAVAGTLWLSAVGYVIVSTWFDFKGAMMFVIVPAFFASCWLGGYLALRGRPGQDRYTETACALALTFMVMLAWEMWDAMMVHSPPTGAAFLVALLAAGAGPLLGGRVARRND